MSAPSPAAGYLDDLPYPDRFHRELTPPWLACAAALGGAPPRKLGEPFVYLDLGCGLARTAIVVAAAFPHAEVHAVDFNPIHIGAARQRAAALGVTNVHLHEALFDERLTRSLPPCDFIVLHGVYSWVSPAVRATLRALIAGLLRPGGLAYVSYNCLPGWSAEAPLRALLRELARDGRDGRDGPEPPRAAADVERAIAAVRRLALPSLRYFRDTPAAAAAVAALARDPVSYVAHEYLNEAWALYYSTEVADQLAEAGAAYVGSATLPDNFLPLVIDRAAAEAIAELPTARQQQLALDFAVNQRFRRDVFVAGPRPAPDRDQLVRQLDQLVLGAASDLDQLTAQVAIPRGRLTLQERFIVELRALLGGGARPLGELVTLLGGPGRSAGELRQNLLFLLAAGSLAPFARPGGGGRSGEPPRTAVPVTARALAQLAAAGEAGVVPSARLGGGATVSAEEARIAADWLAGAAGRPPPDRISRLLLGAAP
jgi:SAM-dependent methyltransferase